MGATSASPIHHKWHEIDDIPGELGQFRDRELESLYQVWLDQKDSVDQKGFTAQLAREWSIETGIIEGVYTLDRGVTQTLIERGIDSSYIPHDATNRDPELVARTIRAHRDALEGLFTFVAGGRELSTGYVKELHAALLQYQETTTVFDPFGTRMDIKLEKGAYKKFNNNPTRNDGSVHEYCPWEHVASEMDRLIEFHKQHEQRGVPTLVGAAWLHHAFTQIHPFQDGNGRVARALASLILIKGGLFPLVVSRDDREKYIDALEAADEGDLGSLVELFGRLQRRDLTKAIVFAAESRPVRTVDDAVAVTREVLEARALVESERRAFELRELASRRLTETADKLGYGLGALKFRFEVGQAQLSIWAGLASGKMLVSFERGLVAGLLVATAEFQAEGGLPAAISQDAFRIDAAEPLDELRRRFLKWLDDVIIRGLAEWRKTLV